MTPARNLGDVIDRAVPGTRPWLIEVPETGADRVIDFATAQATIDAVARGLLKRGLARGDRVGLLAGNSANYMLAYYGIMRAGLCAVPINTKLPRETIAHCAADSAITLVLVDGERAGALDGVPALRLDEPAGWNGLLDPGPFAVPAMRDEEFATILYTSGSSGRPKGVPLTHGGYLWTVEVLNRTGPKVAGKKMLVAAPLYHMNGQLQSMLMSAAGGTVVLLNRFAPRAYLETAARLRCEIITSVPTMLVLVARETETLARLDLSAVEIITTGSAPSTEALFDRIAAIFPQARISNGYGTTESSPVLFGAHPRGLPRPKLALGYPLPESEIELRGGASPDEGVLWTRNRAVMPGYLNLPAETAKRMVDGWYDTGDVMRRDADGFFFFVGRADDMFTCGGENVYPGAVEKMLERHPAILQAAVVPVDDAVKHQVPAAFVVVKPGAALTVDEVKRFALDNGPAYQHPRFVELVASLPLSGTNKIDKHALAARAAAFKR